MIAREVVAWKVDLDHHRAGPAASLASRNRCRHEEACAVLMLRETFRASGGNLSRHRRQSVKTWAGLGADLRAWRSAGIRESIRFIRAPYA